MASDLEVFPISMPGGINQSAPVPDESDMEELENFAIFRNRLGLRAPLALVATLLDDQGSPAAVEAVLDIVEHEGKLWTASWSSITDKVYLHSMQVDGSSLTREAVVWAGVTSKPVVTLASIQGGTIASPQSRLYVVDYNQNLVTKYWNGTTVSTLTNDFDASGAAEDVYFSLMFAHKFHMWGTGFYEGTIERGEITRFSQPGLIPATDPAGGTNPREWFTADHRSVGRRGDKIRAAASVGDKLLLFQKRAAHTIYGSGADTWTRQELSSVVGTVGPFAVAVVDKKVAYFWASDGPYRTDGVTLEYLGAPIRDFVVKSDASETDTLVGYSPDDGLVHFVVSPAGGDSYYLSLVFDTRQERWIRSSWVSKSETTEDSLANQTGTPSALNFSVFKRDSQSFTTDTIPGPLSKIRVPIRRNSSTAVGTVVAEVYAHSGSFGTTSKPTGAALATSEPVDVLYFPPSIGDPLVTFNFDETFTPVGATNYCLVINGLGITEDSGSIIMDFTSTSAHGGNAAYYDEALELWSTVASQDLYFEYISRDVAPVYIEYGTLTALDSAAAPAPSGAPGSVAAVAVSDTGITLSWLNGDTNVDTETHIYRSTSSGFTPNDATNRITVADSGVTSYADSGLSAATTYYYKVKHLRNSQHSSSSAESSGKTWLATPTAVGLGGLTSGLRITGTNNAATQDADIVLQYSTDGVVFNALTTLSDPGASFTYDHTSLTCGNTYYYRAKATKATYTDSPWSTIQNRAACNALVAPTAPSGLTAVATGQTAVDLDWTDNSNNEDYFEVHRSTDGSIYTLLVSLPSGTIAHTDSGLTSNTLYYYKVRAGNVVAVSAFTTAASDTTDPDLDAPTSLATGSLLVSSLVLTWVDNSADETGFEIHQSDTGIGGTYSLVVVVGANVLTRTITGLSASTQYHFKVRAVNGATLGSFSSIASGTTTSPGSPPAPPSNLVATQGAPAASVIDLTWDDNSGDEDGFEIHRAASATGAFALIHTTAAGVESYQNTGLTAGQTYYYKVRATNATNGASAFSNTDDAATDGGASAPAAPSSLVATPNDADLNGFEVREIALTWTDNSINEDSFVIERCTGAACSGFVELLSLPAGSTSYLDTSVLDNTTYRYRVKAVNGVGSSAYATSGDAVVEDQTTPRMGTATDSGHCVSFVATPRVFITWTNGETTGLDKRTLQRLRVGDLNWVDVVAWTSTPEANVSHSDTTVSPGFRYTYRIADDHGASGENTGVFYSDESAEVQPELPDCYGE